MTKVRDTRLWQRVLLVGLTGAVPLFAVSLALISVVYGNPIAFGLQEQRGNAFQRPLERLFELLPRYQLAARRRVSGDSASQLEMSDAERQIDEALRVVAVEYDGEPGRMLQFTDAALLSRHRGSARLVVLQSGWDQLRRAPLAIAASGDGTSQLMESVRVMIEHVGDRSNLILDDDLDSFYLMDITLRTLPDMQQRISDITLRVADRLRDGRARSNDTQMAIMAAMLRVDLGRIARDAQIALSEDANFNGLSPSLHVALPRAIERTETAVQRLFALLDRTEAGEAVPAGDAEAIGLAAHAESFHLFRTGADELDRLLGSRIRSIRDSRLAGYSIIVATLALAGIAMGFMMRSLLSARYAEIAKTQEEMRAKETQLRALGDNLPGGMTYQVMRDFDGTMRFLYVSAGVERHHGVSPEAVLSDSARLYDQIFPDDLPVLRAAEHESLTRKSTFKAVVRMRAPDGATRWMEFCSAPRQLPDGRVVWDGIEMDITDRHLAEASTRQSEERFSRIFDNSPIPITLSGLADGKIIAANDSFLRFSGFTREEVLGRTTADLGLYPDLSDRSTILEQMRLHGRLHEHEQSFRTKSGKLRHTVLWVDELTIAGDECVLVTALDVTEQREAARQQKELEEQLRQAQKLEALGTLAGGIAHDFNNILGAIISYSELTKMDNADNLAVQENVGEVLKASARATTLVRQILSFSRHQKEARVSLQLAPIVREALSLLRATLPSTVVLRQQIDTELPDVLANPTQLHQIIMNLCTNSAHAMKGKQGQLTVELGELRVQEASARPHVELEPGDYVRLTVGDTGHGMDAVTSKRIFEPFFTTKGAGEGTGLGLSVVHGIVKEYGGGVTVDSELGRGTRITLYLPACSAVAEGKPVAVTETPRGNGERILFVDDEQVLGEVAEKMLQRLGYRATVFQSSQNALAAFQREPAAYDALITDLTMPEMTGIDLARQALAIRASLPIILVSGSSGTLTAGELREMGIVDLLSKPLEYSTLAHALNQLLRS